MALSVPRLLPTKTYPFSDWRHLLSATSVQEGVVENEFKVTQRAAGANPSVDIGIANQGAWVRGDDTARQGLYHCVNDATVNLAVPPAHASLPRIDQVVLRIYDSSVIGGGLDQGALEVVQGVPTAGATLDNRNNAGALPASALRLADILVPAASTSVVAANIRDRRPWARGAFNRQVRTNGNFVLASTATAIITVPRLECSGAPLRVTMTLRITESAGSNALIGLLLDGAPIDGTGDLAGASGVAEAPGTFMYEAVPPAGSHVLQWTGKNTAGVGTSTVLASAATPVQMVVEERISQNTDNS